MTANRVESNKMMKQMKMVEPRSKICRAAANLNRRCPVLKNILVLFGVAILVAACSEPESGNLPFPAASLPTSFRSVEPSDSEGIFVVTVWRIPVVLSVDYVPG
jgi:hypothetical protein